jgi:ribosomal protein S2
VILRQNEVCRRAPCCELIEIHLASIKMLSQLPLRLAINDAGTSRRSIAAAAKQSASVFAKVDVDLAMKEIPAKWRTPVSSSRRPD